MREVFGSLPSFTTRDIIDHLRRLLVSGLADTIGETKIAAIDMVNSYDEIGAAAKAKLQPKFEELGLTLQSLTVESISLPEAVEKAIDKRTSMGVLGNIGTYAQYQAAEAIGDAGRNGGIAAALRGWASAWAPACRSARPLRAPWPPTRRRRKNRRRPSSAPPAARRSPPM